MDDAVGAFGLRGRLHDRLVAPLVREGGRLVECDQSGRGRASARRRPAE
jgi:hypothetical protein